VVTHEGVIKSLIYHLCDRKFIATEPAIIQKHQLHRLAHDKNGLRVEELNALAIGT
jgi:probable phosphoglycerate mutase